MVSRIAVYALLGLATLAILGISTPSASAQDEDWTEIGRGRNYIEYQWGDNFKQAIYGGPIFTQVDNGDWVSYVFEDLGDRYQVQHPCASVQFSDSYSVVFSEYFENVVIYIDRWAVQYLNKQGDWSDSSFFNIVRSYEMDENELRLIRTGSSVIGSRREIYTFRRGTPVKIRIEQTCDSAQTIRFVWKPSGIVATTEKVHTDNGKNASLSYYDVDNDWVSSLAWFDELEIVENIDVVCDTHAQGRKATIIFGNFEVVTGGTAVLDPSISTLSDPTEDGYIHWDYSTSYSRENSGSTLYMGKIIVEEYWHLARGYVEWDISSISDNAIVTEIIFKYHSAGDIFQGAHIHAMGNQPSTADNTTLYNDIGDGTVYAEDGNFVLPKTQNEVDLGASARSDLENLLENDWFAIGLQNDDEASTGILIRIYTEEYASANPKPTLYVEYIFPGAPNTPENLKVENQSSPQQLTTFAPEFSFLYTDNGGDNMKAFQIQVGTSSGDNSMWDNATTENAENNSILTITYAGSTLSRGTTYWWRLQMQDNTDKWGLWSNDENFQINQLPLCSITAPPDGYDTEIDVGITFESSASDADSDSLTYLWSFGEGTTSTNENQDHQYSSSGDYTITLVVNDGYEDSTAASIIVNVGGADGGGGGGGPGGGIPSPGEIVSDIVEPEKNILFVPLWGIGPLTINPLMVAIAITVIARYKKQKGIMWAFILGIGFLLFFGSRLV